MTSLYVPGVQRRQSSRALCCNASMAVSSFFFPMGQAVHERWRLASVAGSGLYFPAEQMVQDDDELVGAKVPAPQIVQAEVSTPVAELVRYLPTPQEGQDREPV